MSNKFLTDQALAERFNTSRPTIWRWAQRGILPQPIQLSPGTTRWSADEIDAFEAERLASRKQVPRG